MNVTPFKSAERERKREKREKGGREREERERERGGEKRGHNAATD